MKGGAGQGVPCVVSRVVPVAMNWLEVKNRDLIKVKDPIHNKGGVSQGDPGETTVQHVSQTVVTRQHLNVAGMAGTE